LHKKLIIYMGLSILIGSFFGGFGSDFILDKSINIVYALLATIAAIMMFIPKKEINYISINEVTFNKSLAVGLSFFVGVFSGIVGAAGGFIIVPIMLVILKIPTRITIASSLAIVFISSIGATIGKVI